MELTEHQIQAQILDYLAIKGHFCFRNNSGVMFSEYKGKKRAFRAGIRGGSDIVGVEKGTGRFIGIEVKRPGQKTTPIQDQFLERVRDLGGLALVAHSLEEVTQVL